MTVKYIGGDVETYYDSKTYSLAKKDTTTQQYIEDPRAQTIGWSFTDAEVNKPVWTVGKATDVVYGIDWENTVFMAHNVQFDAGWLEHHYWIRPKHLFCTMAMGRTVGIGKLTGSVSLANMARFFRLPDKGTAVVNANGKRLEDFSMQGLREYGEYCCHDTWLMVEIFKLIRPYIDADELLWHSKVNKAFTEPQCRLNAKVLSDELERVKQRNFELMQRVAQDIGCDIDALGKRLRSSEKFAALLREHGVEPPMKVSKTTGKGTYAFAKSDVAFTDLQDHANPMIPALVMARLGAKSTIEQDRLVKMLALANLPSGKLRVPLRISGAHTHRGSGTDGLNFQNFPSGRIATQSKALRRSIEALPGQYLTAPDSGQIEARVLAFIADDQELLGIFERGECPYSVMGEAIYNVPAAEIYAGSKKYGGGDKSFFNRYIMRQTGKAAILQLGYQAGKKGFYVSLTGTYGVTDINEDQCTDIVDTYRRVRPQVVKFWNDCEYVLDMLVRGGEGHFGGPDGKLFYYNGRQDWFGHKVPSIKLPNNTWLTYPMLQEIKDGWRTQKIYIKDVRKFNNAVKKSGNHAEVLHKHGKRIYGGALTENLCQALAFAALKWQALQIDSKFVSNVHDEHILAVSGDDEAKAAQAAMMRTPPYLEGLVFNCDYELANNYADC